MLNAKSPDIATHVQQGSINSSPPRATYMHQWTGLALVQVMACRLFGAKPLPEPVLTYSEFDKLQWNSNQNTKLLTHENASEEIVCEMAAIFARARWGNIFQAVHNTLCVLLKVSGVNDILLISICRRKCTRNSTIQHLSHEYTYPLNTLRPRQHGRRFIDDILKGIFLNENVWNSIKISLKCVPNRSWLGADQATSHYLNQWWHSLKTHICVTRAQWVKT